MFLPWEVPNGSPVRWSKLMRAKWRLLSSMRCPKGRWGEKLKDFLWWSKWTVLWERSWIVWKTEARRVWLACYHTRCSGVIYTGALQNKTGLWFALEAQYLPKGKLNGCSLDLNARLQSLSFLHCLVVMDTAACLSDETGLFWLLDGWGKVLPNKYFKCHNIAGLVWQRAARSVSEEASDLRVRLSSVSRD